MVVIRAFPLVGDIKDARVYINGKDTGEFTNVRFALPEGTHTYRLQLEEYKDVEGKFEITEGRITRVTTYMIRAGSPTFGKLNISSSPPGAVLYMNDVDIGQYTPTTVYKLSDGDYVYRVSKPGYLDTTGTFTISKLFCRTGRCKTKTARTFGYRLAGHQKFCRAYYGQTLVRTGTIPSFLFFIKISYNARRALWAYHDLPSFVCAVFPLVLYS